MNRWHAEKHRFVVTHVRILSYLTNGKLSSILSVNARSIKYEVIPVSNYVLRELKGTPDGFKLEIQFRNFTFRHEV